MRRAAAPTPATAATKAGATIDEVEAARAAIDNQELSQREKDESLAAGEEAIPEIPSVKVIAAWIYYCSPSCFRHYSDDDFEESESDEDTSSLEEEVVEAWALTPPSEEQQRNDKTPEPILLYVV